MGKLFSNQGGQGATAIANCPSNGGEVCGFGGSMHGHNCHAHNGFNMGHGVGHGTPGAGDAQSINGNCMGQCNPRKVYAETYNYVNQHLIQPTVKEVYNELKNITPENTVLNKEMRSNMPQQGGNYLQAGNPGSSMQGENRQHGHSMQERAPVNGSMGLQNNQMMVNGMGNYMHGNMEMPQNPVHDGVMSYQMCETMQNDNKTPQHHMLQNTTGYNIQGDGIRNYMDYKQMSQQMANQNMAQMRGEMGPQIVNMMKNTAGAKPASSLQAKEGQMPETMPIDALQSYGNIGLESLNAAGEINQGLYNIDTNNANQQMNYPLSPTIQNVNNTNMPSRFNPNVQHFKNNTAALQQSQTVPHGIQNNSNPAPHHMPMSNQNYGQHTLGIKKFNELFPGMMSGDLGFDPMAMAIQLNPENNQKSPTNMMPNTMNRIEGQNNSTIAGGNTAAANMNVRNTLSANQQGIPISSQQIPNEKFRSVIMPSGYNQPYGSSMNTAVTPNQPNQILQQQVNQAVYEANQQPVYSALTGATRTRQAQQILIPQQIYQQQQIDPNKGAITPQLSQEQPIQQMLHQQQQYQNNEQQIDPNTGVVIQQTLLQQPTIGDVNAQMQQQQNPEINQIMIQDPILPIDTSRFQPPPNMRRPKCYHYNTLGQPVEMLPAKLFQSNPETNLPQTLYPQPVTGSLRKDINRFNIKSTISKTSLMANRPVGRTPSRSQLQNIYNQYKGSQSYTQKNVRAAEQGASLSEGKIVQRENNDMLPVPVERVGGDTAFNNHVMNDQISSKAQNMQNNGDVPQTNKPHGDIILTKEAPVKQANCRNGLQDMSYTTYPTSAASWSFHGNSSQRVPFSSNTRRYRRL